jgi:hypothetical protein
MYTFINIIQIESACKRFSVPVPALFSDQSLNIEISVLSGVRSAEDVQISANRNSASEG